MCTSDRRTEPQWIQCFIIEIVSIVCKNTKQTHFFISVMELMRWMPALIHSFILETCIAPLQSRDYYTQRLSQPMQTHAVTDKEEGLQRDIKFGSNTITSNMIIININEDKGQWRSLFIHSFIHSFIPAISIAPLQVLYYSEALPTTARILYRCSTPKRTGNCR